VGEVLPGTPDAGISPIRINREEARNAFESPQAEAWGFLDTVWGAFGACQVMSR